MKKVLFLQNKGKNYAGVWQVNKLVGEELIKKGYKVSIVSIRNNVNDLVIECDNRLQLLTINEKDLWGTIDSRDILQELKNIHLLKSSKMLKKRLLYEIGLKKDIKKLHQFIKEYDPDYIITSHYQLLDMIPKSYLKRTIHEQHSSFKDANGHSATMKTLMKYKDKIAYLWLSNETCNSAKKVGIKNSYYIYNAVRFHETGIADVINNKKLITIARLDSQKRIDTMIKIVDSIFKDSKYCDWSMEIYGTGNLINSLNSLIVNKKQIKLMGLTNNPREKLMTASINLNTSLMEGFAMSILEANECGVPTVSFNFGESVYEQIIDGQTGLIIENDNLELYEKKLRKLMDNKQKLSKLSNNCKDYSKNFYIENIINEWISLFNKVGK